MMSSGNKKMEQPSFRATLIMYVAFNFFSSAIIEQKKRSPLIWSVLSSKLGYSSKLWTIMLQEILPLSPLETRFQLTTLGSTALRSSRKKIPFDRLLSWRNHRFQNTRNNKSMNYDLDNNSNCKTVWSIWTLKLCIWEVLPVLLTLLLAHFKISASVISFPREWDLRFLKSWSILNLINCHRKAETDENKILAFNPQETQK